MKTPQQPSAETLHRREKWFRSLTENALDIITILDGQGIFIYDSPSVERVLGYQPHELIGQNAFALVHPDDLSRVLSAFQNGIQNPGQTVTLEFRLRHRNGSWRYLEAMGKSLLDDPDIRGVVINSRDISERKQAEERLRQNEEKFRQITENVADLIAVIDLEGRRIYNSPSYRTLLGEPDSAQGTDSFGEVHPEDRDRIRQLFLDTVRTGTGQRAEYRFLLKNGSIRFIESQGSVIRDGHGKVINIIVVSRDVTEREQAEERIREQATLLDQAQDAICLNDLEQTILYWNKSAERLYGWTAGEAVGQNANDLLFQGELARPQEALKNLIKKGLWKGELNQVTKEGAKIIVESRWSLMRDQGGKPKSILVVNTDITEKKQIEAQFLRTQRMESIGALAGGIAHDLNNMLAPILMSAEVLRDELANERSRAMLDTVKASALRGSDMVKQILSFARGVSGDPTALQVEGLVAEIVRLLSDTFPRSIRIQTKVAKGLCPIMGNSTQLHQVLMNLCVNARDAMPEGGSLSIAVNNVVVDESFKRLTNRPAPGPYVVLTVSDSGKGILPELMGKIFEPFFTTKEIGHGTGLGLSTVLGIVKSHKGFVDVSSQVGIGTAFKVYLPAMTRVQPAFLEDKRSELPMGHGEQILLVDDESAILEITRVTLETYNYRVLTATDGAQAVKLYQDRRGEIGAVVTDMMMPIMDGPSMIRALKMIEPRIRVIGVSGLDSRARLSELDLVDVKAFLTKPYSTAKLLATLRQVLVADTRPN